jgi:hypothetical protein
MSLAKKIKDTFFYSPSFCIKKMEGQSCEEKKYLVGAKAGPSCSFSNLFHEICHFAELEKQRIVKFPSSSWGLYPGKFWQINTSWGYEQSTDQQVQREARVWAYQLSVQKHFGLDDSAYNLVDSVVWLPAWCFYRFKWGGAKHEKKAIYKLSKHVERLSKRNSYQKLIDEFSERIKLIEKYT